MFVDASALVAMLVGEPDGPALQARLLSATVRLTSGVALYEAGLAAARIGGVDLAAAEGEVSAFVAGARLHIVSIGLVEARVALEAHARFGRGRHPARLNMGDCFAYACARSRGVPLLYKGEDFALTDIEAG